MFSIEKIYSQNLGDRKRNFIITLVDWSNTRYIVYGNKRKSRIRKIDKTSVNSFNNLSRVSFESLATKWPCVKDDVTAHIALLKLAE